MEGWTGLDHVKSWGFDINYGGLEGSSLSYGFFSRIWDPES